MGLFLKSLLFSIAFYTYTAFCCFILTFAFILPRKAAFKFVQVLYFRGIAVVERLFLNLDYHVEGRENLPKEGSYILAVKHYSTYETLKVPVIFGDIAIILKRELTWIPFWGWYTIKTGMIPVDRGGGQKALASLVEGGKRVITQGRPILIFPQGTRVAANDTTKEKPYKYGIARIAETLNLPVIPVALNSAAFWPKHAFLIKSGTVDFKILPPIPAGLPASEILKRLEDVLEPESNTLMQNAKISTKGPRWIKILFVFLIILAAAWGTWWHKAASMVQEKLASLPLTSPYKPQIDGFPGSVRVTWPDVTYQSSSGTINIPVFEAHAWPLPAGRGEFIAPQGFTVQAMRDSQPIEFAAQDFTMHFGLPGPHALHILGINLKTGGTTLNGEGHIAIPVNHDPINGDFKLSLNGYSDFLNTLSDQRMIERNTKKIANNLFDVMSVAQAHPGSVDVPITVQDDVIYAGMIRLVDISDLRAPAVQSAVPPQRSHSGGSVTDAPRAPDLQTPASGSAQ